MSVASQSRFTTTSACAPPRTRYTQLAVLQLSPSVELDMDLQRAAVRNARRARHDQWVAEHEAAATRFTTGLHRAKEQYIAARQLLVAAANNDLRTARKSLPAFLSAVAAAHCVAQGENGSANAPRVMNAREALGVMHAVWATLLAEFDGYCNLVLAEATRHSNPGLLNSEALDPAAFRLGALEIISSLGIWFRGLENGMSVGVRPSLQPPVVYEYTFRTGAPILAPTVKQCALVQAEDRHVVFSLNYFVYSSYVSNDRAARSMQTLAEVQPMSPVRRG